MVGFPSLLAGSERQNLTMNNNSQVAGDTQGMGQLGLDTVKA